MSAVADVALVEPRTEAAAAAVPLDLATLREAWRIGDWAALDAIDDTALAGHPERARLHALRAAARLALGRGASARDDAAQALRAGCDATLLRRVLAASVHNTLGRACAASPSLHARAARHFRKALAPAGSHPRRDRWVQARVERQLEQAGIGRDSPAVIAALTVSPPPVAPWKALQDLMQQAQSTWTSQVKTLSDQVASWHRGLDNTLRREMSNAVAQVEAHANLQSYLSGAPVVPQLHGWPISPDFAMLMVDLIETHEPDAVIEFGSGASTVLIAHALNRVADRRKIAPLHLSFEHLPQYHDQTAQMLQSAGLRDRVRLCLAPLVPLPVARGEPMPCYAGGSALDELARDLAVRSTRPPRLLIVVDGPPGTTGPRARYPVLELVHRSIPVFSGHVLLDDYGRPDEKVVAADWCAYLASHGVAHHMREVELEKSACVITIAPGDPVAAKRP